MMQPSFDDLEVWKPVVGWDGFYEVSSAGRVRSVPRVDRRGKHVGGVVLKPSRSGAGYPHVDLWADGKHLTRTTHSLVAEAFIGPRPDGQEVRHLDGDYGNPRLSNLAYGTSGENKQDMLRHGRHYNAGKTHCDYGHEFTPENTYTQTLGGRGCRECHRRISREYNRRKRKERRGA